MENNNPLASKRGLLTAEDRFGNPYEQYFAQHRYTPRFDAEQFDKFYRNGDANTFIGIQEAIDDMKQEEYDELVKEFRLDLEQGDYRTAVLTNRLFADNTEIKSWTDEYVDEYGQKQTETYEATEMQHNEKQYKKYADQLTLQEEYKIKEQLKEEWRKTHQVKAFFSDALAVASYGMDVVLGAIDAVYDLVSIPVSAIGGIVYAAQDGASWDEGYKRMGANLYEWSPSTQLRQEIAEFKMDYTAMADVYGNFSWWDKTVSGLANSFGRMIPSMVLTSFGVPGKISEIGYYVSMSQGEFNEMAADPVFKDTPGGELMMNTALRSAAEYFVQEGLNQLIDPSAMDRAAFAYRDKVIDKATEITWKTAIKDVFKDAVHEGLEEYFQQFSGYLINGMFGYFDEEFNINNKFDFETQRDALVLGFFGSLGSQMVMFGVDRMKYGYRGGIKTFLSDWEFRKVYQDMAEQIEYLNKKAQKGKVYKQRIADTVNGLIFTTQSISNYLSSIGEIRSAKALDLLDKISEYNKTKGNLSEQQLTDKINEVVKEAKNTLSELGVIHEIHIERIKKERADKKEQKKSFKEKLSEIFNKRKVTEVKKVTTIKDITEDTKNTQNKKLTEVLNKTNSDAAVITSDGNGAEKNDNVLVIPEKDLNNRPVEVIVKEVAQRDVIERVSESSRFTKVKTKLESIFKKMKGITTETLTPKQNEQMMLMLLFNSDFQKLCLAEGSMEMYELVSVLDEFMSIETVKRTHGIMATYDEVMNDQVNKAKTQLKEIIKEYLVNQQYAKFEHLTILTEKEKQDIYTKRYSKDLANRIVFDDSVSDKDYHVIQKRISYTPMSPEKKTQLIRDIKSSDIRDRMDAMYELNKFYRNQFFSSYDGVTYLPVITTANQLMNIYLQKKGITASQLYLYLTKPGEGAIDANYFRTLSVSENTPEAIREAILNDINRFSQDRLNVSTNGGQISVTLKNVSTDYSHLRDDEILIARRNRYSEVLASDFKSAIDSIVADNSNLYDINEVVFDTSVELSEGIKSRIETDFSGKDTWETRLYAIRDYLTDTSTKTVSFMPDGTLAVVDLKDSYSMLTNKGITVSSVKDGDKLTKHIKGSYLQGLGKDVIIELADEDSEPYYDGKDTIYLPKINDDKIFRANLIHETQHVIQEIQGLNGGMDSEWLSEYSQNPENKKSIEAIYSELADIAPELFKDIKAGTEEFWKIVSDVVYYSTGEFSAYGQSGIVANHFIPFIVQDSQKGLTITTPLGNRYELRAGKKVSSRILIDENEIHTVPELVDSVLFNERFQKFVNYRFGKVDSKNAIDTYDFTSEIIDKSNGKIKDLIINEFRITPLMDPDYKTTLRYKSIIRQYISDEIAEDFRKLFAAKHGISSEEFENFRNVKIPFVRFTNSLINNLSVPLNSVVPAPGINNGQMIRDVLLRRTENETYVMIGEFTLNDLLVFYPDGSEALLSDESFSKNYIEVYKLQKLTDNNFNLSYKGQLKNAGNIKKISGKIIYSDVQNIRFHSDNFYGIVIENNQIKNIEDVPYEVLLNTSESVANENNISLSEEYLRQIKEYSDDKHHDSVYYMPTNGSVPEIIPIREYLERVLVNEQYLNNYGQIVSIADLKNDILFSSSVASISISDNNLIVKTAKVITNKQLEMAKKVAQLLDIPTFQLRHGDQVFEFDVTDNLEEDVRKALMFNPNDIVKKMSSKKLKTEEVHYITEEETEQKKKEKYKEKYGEKSRKRYIPNYRAKGTNLENYIQRWRPIRLSTELANFILDADPVQLDPELWDMIAGTKKGTLRTERQVTRWLKDKILDTEGQPIDDYTLSLIGKHLYGSKVTSYKEVENFTDNAMEFYILSSNLWNKEEQISEVPDGEYSLKDAIEYVNNTNLSEAYASRRDRIELHWDHVKQENGDGTYSWRQVEISNADLKLAFIMHFDGTLRSLIKAADIARKVAIENHQLGISTVQEGHSSTSRTGKTYETSFEDVEGTDSGAMFDAVFDSTTREDMEEYIRNSLYDEYIPKWEKEGRTEEYIDRKLENLETNINKMSNDAVKNMYYKLLIRKTKSDIQQQITEQEVEQANETPAIQYGLRTNTRTRIKSAGTRIGKLVPDTDVKRFLKENGDIYGEDMKLKQEAYEGKTQEELDDLWDRLQKIRKKARAHAYQSVRQSQEWDRVVKKVERLETSLAKQKDISQRQRTKFETGIEKRRTKEYDFGGATVVIDQTTDMPLVVRKIMETNLSQTYKTDITTLSNADEEHARMSRREFIAFNYETLSSMTEEDIQQTIEFFENSSVRWNGPDDEMARRYGAFSIYTLSYMLGLTDESLEVSPELKARAEAKLKEIVSVAGTELAAWAEVIRAMRSEEAESEVFRQASRKIGLIEVNENQAIELIRAVRAHDMNALNEAMDNIKKNLERQCKGRKRNLFDKLIKLQRAAMLSSPGTWIRNWVSNVMVTAGNNASSVIGKLFTSRSSKFSRFEGDTFIGGQLEEQYVLTGTKVTKEVSDFIQTQFVESGLLSLIQDGMNRYDSRKIHSHSTESTVADLIIEGIKSKVFAENQFNTDGKVGELTNKLVNLVMNRLSDDYWVNRKAISYFGKMLTEEEARTGRNLHTHATNTTYEMLADAYVLASFDYMHKANFWNKIEDTIREKMGPEAYFVWKQLFPFASASWNWAVEALKYSPFGLAKAVVDTFRMEKIEADLEIRRQHGEVVPSSKFTEFLVRRNLGKGIIGSMLWGLGAALAAFGIVRLDDNDDGLKLYFGNDIYVDVSNIFGSSSLLAGAALVGQKYIEGYDFWDSFKLSLSTTFNDWMFTDIYNSFRYEDSIADWLISQPSDALSKFIPNIIKQVATMVNVQKVKYSSNSFLNSWERLVVSSIPGLAYAFPTAVDPYTGEKKVKYKLSPLFDFIGLTGVKIRPYDVSEAEQEAIANGVRRSQLTGRYEDLKEFGIVLDRNDIESLNKIYGTLNKSSLEELMNNKKKYKVMTTDGTYKELLYKNMTSEQKKSVINRIMNDNASIAKIYMATKKGLKYYTSSEEREELMKLGIKNVFIKTDKKEGFVQ